MRREAGDEARAGRRDRTRRLIVLGTLVERAGLAAACDDDLDVILGACRVSAALLRGPRSSEAADRFRQAGADKGGAKPDGTADAEQAGRDATAALLSSGRGVVREPATPPSVRGKP